LATQDSLFETTEYLAVATDFGQVETGASLGHWILAENGSEYLIKGPSFTPDHPTVAANEWVAAQLAAAMGLPVLDHRIVTMGGHLFFGSSWMEKPSFHPAIDESLLARCRNRDRVYGVVVLDTWLCNPDRHAENLVVRRVRNSNDHLLLLNDHSHLLVSPAGARTGKQLLAHLDVGPASYVRLEFVKASIASADRLRHALQTTEALPEERIRGIVESTPDELLPDDYRGAYEEFLVQRLARLSRLFEDNSQSFPELDGPL
jgi:hypothetical protein